jgi:PAS domain S-box-containing protein
MKVQSDISSIFEETFNLMPGLTILTDARLKVIRVNQAFLQIMGRRSSQVIGQDLLKTLNIGEAEDAQIREHLSSHLSSSQPVRFEAFIPTGPESGIAAIVDTRFFPYQDEVVGLMVINDITEKKINEENLRIANEKIHRFLDDANDLVQSVAPDGSILFANQKWLSTLGYVQADLPELNITDILREDQVPHCFTLMERVKHKEQLEFVETVFKTKDNREIFVEGNIDGQFDNGKFIASRCIFRDITSRKNMEETYTRLVKNFPQPIYIIYKGLFKYINPSFIKLTGYSENELLDKIGRAHV